LGRRRRCDGGDWWRGRLYSPPGHKRDLLLLLADLDLDDLLLLVFHVEDGVA
jgi:hypothetical protein